MNFRHSNYKTFICALFVAIFMLVCSACHSFRYEYTEDSIVFTEPHALNTTLVKGKRISLHGNEYLLGEVYPAGKQNSFVEFSEKLFSLLNATGYTVVLGKGFASRAEGKTLYLASDDKATLAVVLLQSVGDPRLPYGLVYGLGEHLRCRIEGKGKTDDARARALLLNRPVFADLNAPLFFAPFSTEEEIGDAKLISSSFTEWVFRERGEEAVRALWKGETEALADGGEEALLLADRTLQSLIKEYMGSENSNFSPDVPSVPVRYSTCSAEYPLCIHTSWGQLYINGKYSSPYAGNAWYEEAEAPYSDFTAEGIKATLSSMDAVAKEEMCLFGLAQNELQRFDYFLDDFWYSLGVGGQVQDDKVVLCSLSHFAHEFCHVVFVSFGFYSRVPVPSSWIWLSEGIAVYVSEDGTPDWNGLTGGTIKLAREGEGYAEYYAAHRPAVSSDCRAYNDVIAYVTFKSQEGTDLPMSVSYEQWGSFVYWLVDTSGAEELFSSCRIAGEEETIFDNKQPLWEQWGNELYAAFGDTAPDNLFGLVG